MKILKSVKLAIITTFLLLSPTAALAQPLPNDTGTNEGDTTIGDFIGQGEPGASTLSVKRLGDAGVESVGRLISAAFNVALLLAGIFVFGMLIMGGYGWITAGGDKQKVEEARTRITNAIIGIAIVASAWALVMIIGQFFGFNISELKLPTATGENTGEAPGGVGL